MMRNKKVTICVCASRPLLNKEKVARIAAILKENAYDVRLEPDLCRSVMEKNPKMEAIASSVILACYPRAVRSLLDSLDLTGGQVIDLRSGTIPEVLDQFGEEALAENVTADQVDAMRCEVSRFAAEEGTDAWYPALDKERCVECGKCHDFCLFGVYAVRNKEVRVVQPRNCKINCPACARMCPSKAIIFPKYEKSPINGGIAQEEQFDPDEMDSLYRERLRYRLEQRRAGVSLLKDGPK